jgi:hypothetical protein
MVTFLIGATNGTFKFENLPGAENILDDDFSDWVYDYQYQCPLLPELSLSWNFGYESSFRRYYGFFLTAGFLEINTMEFDGDLSRIRGWFRSINIEPSIFLLSERDD